MTFSRIGWLAPATGLLCGLLVLGGAATELTRAAAAPRTALINGDSVVSSSDQPGKSDEQIQAEANGYSVTVVTGSTWAAMTEAQFRAYDVLIVGDADCNFIPASVTSSLTWTQAVMDSGGNRFTIGSDPVYHSDLDSTSNRNHIIKDGIAFAGGVPGTTGAYVDTTCEASGNNTAILNALSVSGAGWSVETPACAGNIGIVASNPAFSDTHDADLSNWSCSSHADYPTFAPDWVPFAVSADAPTKGYCAKDIETGATVCGEPYILVAGAGVTVKSDITLSPATATNPVGGSHTVTATVMKGGSPEAGTVVTFTISAGPNAGTTGTGTTDANGQTTFTYTDVGGPGTDTIVAKFTDDIGAVQEATASKTWVVTSTATNIVYSGPASGDYNDPVTVSARLTDTGSPASGIASEPLTFTLGSASCGATTDSTGSASCTLTPSLAAGSATLSVSFAGDSTHMASSTTATFTVTLEETALSSTGTLQLFSAGGAASLSSTLTDPDGGAPIAGKAVTMTLGSGSGAQSCTATTGASGTATCSISPVTVGLGPQPVTDSFVGDAFYKPATNAQQALVFAFSPGGSFVVGDQSATGSVTFWGAQWTKANNLSGGAAPASFKGFEDAPAVSGCGTGWTTDPGNSPPPPTGPLPSYMAVVVASQVTQSGSTISGNTVHILIVKTNPGYRADPGHTGTGTVVGSVC